MKGLFKIIEEINASDSKVKPTEIYNEGWMTSLLMHYSVIENIPFSTIGIDIDGNFANNNWTSEGLISSPFITAKAKREGYTHPDIAIGDFKVDYSVSGKLNVNEDAKLFGIIEAKMKSPLSNRTSNVKDFNQASRSVACIANNTKNDCVTFFYVVLPITYLNKEKRDGTTIIGIVNHDSILEQIKVRVKTHNNANESDFLNDELLERARKCKIGLISYEQWILAFKDKECYNELNDFYVKCLKYNKIPN